MFRDPRRTRVNSLVGGPFAFPKAAGARARTLPKSRPSVEPRGLLGPAARGYELFAPPQRWLFQAGMLSGPSPLVLRGSVVRNEKGLRVSGVKKPLSLASRAEGEAAVEQLVAGARRARIRNDRRRQDHWDRLARLGARLAPVEDEER